MIRQPYQSQGTVVAVPTIRTQRFQATPHGPQVINCKPSPVLQHQRFQPRAPGVLASRSPLTQPPRPVKPVNLGTNPAKPPYLANQTQNMVYTTQQPQYVAYHAQQSLPYQTQQPMASHTKQPLAYQTQQTMAPHTMQPLAYQTQQPMAPLTQQPLAYQTQELLVHQNQEPLAYQTQQPMAAYTQQPMASYTQQLYNMVQGQQLRYMTHPAQQPHVYNPQQPQSKGQNTQAMADPGTQQSTKPSIQQRKFSNKKAAEVRSEGLRILSGRVGKVKEWMALGLPCSILYRVYGSLSSEVQPLPGLKTVTKSKKFELSSEDGQKIVCDFQEVDRELGVMVPVGESVVVTGRARGEGVLQVLSVEGGGLEGQHSLSRLENFGVRGIRLVLAQREGERLESRERC